MRAVFYGRISSDRVGLELGISRQREDGLALIKQRGWTLVGEHVDNDLSATHGAPRPGYAALLEQIGRGEVDRVVVYMTSRLWRNRRERVEGMERFQQAKIGLTPVKGPELDFSSAVGRMVAGILGEVDTAEVEIKSERAQREVLQRAQQGRPHGGPRAYGVTADGLALVDDEADEIRRWYELILAGGSISSIVRDTGRHHASIADILRNPRNAGLRILNGEVYKAPNPPIVTEATWRAVCSILDDPGRRINNEGSSRKWIGAGLFGCTCGRKVKTNYSGGSGGAPVVRVYACFKRLGGCGKSWRAEPIDAYVTKAIRKRLGRADLKNLLPAEQGADLTALTTEATSIRRRLADLGAAFGKDDAADLAEFRSAAQTMRDRLADVEGRMTQAGRTGAVAAILAADDPVAAWDDLDDVDRRKAVIGAFLVVTLLPSPRGRPSHTRRVEDVVRLAWRDTTA